MSTNSAAIVLGVQKWLDNNSDLVTRCIERGVERGIIAIAEVVGSQLSQKGGQWMKDNSSELVTAIAGQVSIGALAELPGLKRHPDKQSPVEQPSKDGGENGD